MTAQPSDDVLNPVRVEQEIQRVTREIHRGVQIVTDATAARDDASREYDKAYAQAFIAAGCAQTEKRYHAELATQDERQRRDETERAYWYARKRADALVEELSGLQSIGSSVRSMYGATR